jgi:hypothetical protein
MSTLSRKLKSLGACDEAIDWAIDYATLADAWQACERGDWMLWLCARMEYKAGWPMRKEIVLAACDCASLALPVYEQKFPSDDRVRHCIEVIRRWAHGEVTLKELRKVKNAVYAAADAAAAAAVCAAEAVYAADAAYAAAAADAAYAAAAAHAAHAAHAAAAILKQCADICRSKLKIGELESK